MTHTDLQGLLAMIRRAQETVGGISIERMGGDNLAVTLCSHFDDAEGEQDDNGWTEAATAGYEETVKAIRDHYAPVFDALLADLAAKDAEIAASIADVWKQAEDNHRTYSDTGDRENDIRFLTLGLTGEAGEVANFVKKRWRDGDGHDEAIRLEIADVCAYAFMLASTMGMTPADLIATIAHKQQVFVAKMNAARALHQSPEGKGS